jgi:hypothetical protein
MSSGPRNGPSLRFVTLVTFDTALIALAVAAGAYARLGAAAGEILMTQNCAIKTFLIAGISQVCDQ